MKELWRKYTTKLFRSYGRNQSHHNELDLKKDIIFKYTLTILLPLSTVAFGPGIIYSFHVDLPYLGIADIIALVALIIITLPIRLSLEMRKIIFITISYFIAIVAIWYVGMLGPGLILLLAACLFGIVFFSNKSAIYFAHLNLIILILFAALLNMDYFDWRNFIIREHIVEEWVAVAGNVILMSYLFAFIIPYVFKKMQSTINEEHRLKEKLELKQQELEKTLSILHRKNEELEQFAYIASHDLQEPLRMVSSFMEKIDQKYGDVLDEKGKTYLHFAVDGSKRMRKMIIDLLEYSRFQRSIQEAEWINLNEILKVEIETFQEEITATQSTLIIGGLPTIFAPKSSIIRLFQNLISNAIKYRKKEALLIVEITCQENEKEYLFSVKDNGIGIEEKYQSKVFTIFQRLHREEEISGSGLGLAICKKVITDLGGEIWFESNSNEGTNFLFTLPKSNINNDEKR
jgi:signal transduction histidine kinase